MTIFSSKLTQYLFSLFTLVGLRIHKNSANYKTCIQTLKDPTYVLKVSNLTQDLIFEVR